MLNAHRIASHRIASNGMVLVACGCVYELTYLRLFKTDYVHSANCSIAEPLTYSMLQVVDIDSLISTQKAYLRKSIRLEHPKQKEKPTILLIFI